jgi:prepilin-type N-terminal cleavage/methylation domain-containing protein
MNRKNTTHCARTIATGFTLVELLVALTLSSILILTIHSAFRVGVKLWRHVETPRPFEEQGRRTLTLFRSELAGLYLPDTRHEKNRPLVHEKYESNQWKLAFFTTTPSFHQNPSASPCARVTYELRTADNHSTRRNVLIRREQWVAGEKPVADPTANVLAEGMSACSVQLLDEKGAKLQMAESRRQTSPAMLAIELQWSRNASGQPLRRPVRLQTTLPIPVQASLLPEE